MNTIHTATEILDLPVSEIALTYPQSLPTLTKHNIDFCCGGKRSLKEACEKRGLNPEAIRNEIVNNSAVGAPFHLRFSSWSTPLLIDYIIQNHHEYVGEAIIQLQELLDKVCSVHGADYVELLEIRSTFNFLCEELLMHMHKEEIVLFPSIIKISQSKLLGQAHLGSELESLIRAMEDDHETAGNLMKSIRILTHQYTIPQGACPTLSMTYKKLEEFDQDLMQHVHVENNVLFERVKNF
jgi:regulator of cell morphogenesis and NO signaling